MTNGQLQNDISGLPKLNAFNYENLFKIYRDADTDPYYYNILNTVALPDDLDPSIYYDYVVPGPFVPWTTLSYKVYGTIKLWWVICLSNKIIDPTSFPTSGATLKIIKPENVREILSAIKQAQ
jgi:hypothetical protein